MALTIIVSTTAEQVELVCDVLWSLGVVAIEEHWDTDHEVRLQTSLGDDREVVTQVLDSLSWSATWTFCEVDESVGDAWRHFAKPVRVGKRILVAPQWSQATLIDDILTTMDKPQEALIVSIEPGSTFGMGDHPTTMASLLAIEKYLRVDDDVIDVGCGSGVLGITALMLGARSARGIDISAASIEVSHANAVRNGVADRWNVSTATLAQFGEPVQIVVANILAPVLIELSEQLRRLVSLSGVLIISGVLTQNYAHVAESLRPLREIDRIDLEQWSAVVFTHE
ncbi:MAG: 50S ribosomal protein L11 methyltransferase [Actinomycetes bacterium]